MMKNGIMLKNESLSQKKTKKGETRIMPKISNSWLVPDVQAERKQQKRSNVDTKDVFLYLKEGESVRGRLVGGYISFVEHWNRVDKGRDEANKIVWKQTKFPDAEERNHKPTRICTDETPGNERFNDIDKYVKTSSCAWCRLKLQGYHGMTRYAFNLLIHEDEEESKCRILSVPASVMQEVAKICEKYKKFLPINKNEEPDPGSVNGEVIEFVFSKPTRNTWKVEKYVNLDVDDGNPGIEHDLVGISESDKKALRVINNDATTDEELLQGHDLERWFRKDYLSVDYQKKLAKHLGLEPGEFVDISPYEQSTGAADTVEDFEDELDEEDDAAAGEVEEVEEVEDEWGSLDDEEETE